MTAGAKTVAGTFINRTRSNASTASLARIDVTTSLSTEAACSHSMVTTSAFGSSLMTTAPGSLRSSVCRTFSGVSVLGSQFVSSMFSASGSVEPLTCNATKSRMYRSVSLRAVANVADKPFEGVELKRTKPFSRPSSSVNCSIILGRIPISSSESNFVCGCAICRTARSPVFVPWLRIDARYFCFLYSVMKSPACRLRRSSTLSPARVLNTSKIRSPDSRSCDSDSCQTPSI